MTLRLRTAELFAKHGPVRDATLTEWATEWAAERTSSRDDMYSSIARAYAATEFKTAYLRLVRGN
jgi:hypothetical protein